MKPKNKKTLLYILITLMLALSACSEAVVAENSISAGQSASGATTQESASQTVNTTPVTAEYDDDDFSSAVIDGAIPITLNGDSISVPEGNIGVTVNDSIATITAAGEYVLSGTLNNGQIIVETEDTENVLLFLAGVNIHCESSAPIYVANADKVIITLVEGTENNVSDGMNYANLDESGEPNAAIFSHDDLTIIGSGSLTVQGNYSGGIESRDDLKITGGNLSITAVGIGMFGNNSFEMETAAVDISAGGDAIHSDGDIIIESGMLTLSSGDDAIHADGTITINDGAIDIQMSYEGLEATDVTINGGIIDIVARDDGINGAGGNDGSGNAGQGDNFGGSQCSISITGGTITIEAAISGNGDGLDANGTIAISGGDLVIKVPASYRDYSNIDYNTSFSLTGGSVRTLDLNGTYSQVNESTVANDAGGGRHK